MRRSIGGLDVENTVEDIKNTKSKKYLSKFQFKNTTFVLFVKCLQW